jgi:predicted Zn-dependent protease
MRLTRWLIVLLVVLPLGAIGISSLFAGEDEILKAMRAELTRSKEQLHLPDYASPYFVAYRLTETEGFSATGVVGAILEEGDRKERKLYVEVRVGDYALDNSSTAQEWERWDPDLDTFNYWQYVDWPLDDDTDAIRGILWRMTDLRFKNAQAEYLRKRALGVYRENPDENLDDFSRETPAKHYEPPLTIPIDGDYWRGAAREASSILKRFPELLDDQVQVNIHRVTRYYVNSEGTELVTREFRFSFIAEARALAEDGLSVENHFARYARSPAGIPSREELLRGVKEMAEQVVALRRAPILGPYTGPAILDPTVAGVFVHEAIGHRLEGNRMRGLDEGHTFKRKLGEKILPDFINVYDDPTTARFGAEELNGAYAFDDEGVPARRVELVRRGTLVNFLLSRMPVPGFNKSNAHGRASDTRQPMSRMGNVIVQAERTESLDKLRARLLQLARRRGNPYGLWLRQGMGGETNTSQYNFQAFANRPVLLFRVDAKTGREELVRGAEVVGTPLLSISKIVAAGDDPAVFNGYCGAESGFVPVSSVSPSLLVGEIEMQRVRDKPTKPPVLPPPFAE